MPRFLLILIFALGVASCQNQPPAPTKAPIITTQYGNVQGLSTEDADIYTYNGIPYAASPVGKLRWKPPQPPAPWDGIRDASDYGPQCHQIPGQVNGWATLVIGAQGFGPIKSKIEMAKTYHRPLPTMSEDCLYLNVRTGNVGGEMKKPVMVWLHGGAHKVGSGALPSYQANGLVKKDIVLVTTNYRLGPFGYMAHPALSAEDPHGSSGNYGVLDHIAALKWVEVNIAAFGGDPNNITIFGESAGGHAVSQLMASPLAEGLFDKAILQSGVFTVTHSNLDKPTASFQPAEALGAQLMNEMEAQTLAEMRDLSAGDIIAYVAEHSKFDGTFLPNADGYVLPKTVAQTILQKEMTPVPILLGYNADEGSLFYPLIRKPATNMPDMPEDPSARIEVIKRVYGDQAETLISVYGLDDPVTQPTGEAGMYGDSRYGAPSRLLATQHAEAGHDAYLYFFTRTSPRKEQTGGAYHSAEIPFVFDSHTDLLPRIPADDRLTDAIGTYWTNFAKTGNPNGSGLPDWPVYNSETAQWMILDYKLRSESAIRKTKLDALEAHLIQQAETYAPRENN